MAFTTDLETLRREWMGRAPAERASLAQACGWSAESVTAAFQDVRILETTPVGDLIALATHLGVPIPNREAIAEQALGTARAQLRRRTREMPDPEAAADEVLRLLRRRSLPIDLDHLAARMGVNAIRRRPTLVDGRLLAGPDGTFVEVSSERGYARQRFTIAHELGHLWLSQQQGGQMRPLDWRNEERFCDRFAAAVLMPRPWLEERASASTIDLRALELLALEARTSMSATLIRVREFDARWTPSLLKFRPGARNAWRVVGVTGASHGLYHRLGCSADTTPLLEAAVTARGFVTGPLRLLLDGKTFESDAEALGRHRTVVVFATLRLIRSKGAATETGRSAREPWPCD